MKGILSVLSPAMQTAPKWSRIAKYILTAYLASWTHVVAYSLGFLDPKPWYVLAALSFRLSAPIAAVLLIAALEVYQEIKYQPSRVLLRRFLNHLHKKYFPHRSGERDPDFRVTLLTPGTIRRGSLGVRVRSGGLQQKSRLRWNTRRSEAEDFHGIAGYAWAIEIFVEIDQLPDYDSCSPVERQRYLKTTFVSEIDVSKLNWKSRSYRALVVKNQRSEKVGVLMMESKRPDGLLGINAGTFSSEAEYLQFLLA